MNSITLKRNMEKNNGEKLSKNAKRTLAKANKHQLTFFLQEVAVISK